MSEEPDPAGSLIACIDWSRGPGRGSRVTLGEAETGRDATMSVLVARDLVKSFRGGDGGVVSVLNGVNLSVARGEMIAVVGASGAGKSTLLHVIGALDRPDRGEVVIGGQSLSNRIGR